MAFVRQPDFEIVLVDGELGHWATGAEAQAAAERAFDAWLAEDADRAGLALAAICSPPEPPNRGKRVRMGTKAILTATIASWWPFRRSRRLRPEA
jgi:hypothetical protein